MSFQKKILWTNPSGVRKPLEVWMDHALVQLWRGGRWWNVFRSSGSLKWLTVFFSKQFHLGFRLKTQSQYSLCLLSWNGVWMGGKVGERLADFDLNISQKHKLRWKRYMTSFEATISSMSRCTSLFCTCNTYTCACNLDIEIYRCLPWMQMI